MPRGKLGEHNNVLHQGYQVLEAQFRNGKGVSKHRDKAREDGIRDKIYSDETLHTYKRAWKDFCQTMKADGHRAKTLEQAAEYIPTYIENLKTRPGKSDGTIFSAWSIHTYVSAVCKVVGRSSAEYDLPDRHRRDITRSRGETKTNKHFSVAKNVELINFCCSTGLRNHKELQQICGTDLIDRGNGEYAIRVRGKGGKVREALVFGSPDEVRQIVDRMNAAGSGRVWKQVHSNADIHSYRAIYAQRIYDAYARDPATIPFSERYYCRGDKKGVVYDRQAMAFVSRQLGHSRISVIAAHYLNG